MGLINWTDSLVNGDTVTQTHITNLKNDIATILNGGISNSNVSASAAIAESKLAFNVTTGHTHNGTDAAYALIKHYRRGMQVQYTSATTVTVLPGVIDVGGKLLITITSTVLDITANFIAGQSEPADGPVYIYVYNNAGAAGFKMSTLYPSLSDASGNVLEFPLRYQLNTAVYYRCIGIIHNRTDISADMCNNFDLSNFATGSFVGDGNDEEVFTGWTPNFVQWVVCADDAPATTDAMDKWGNVQRYGFITANPQPKDLMYSIIDNQHLTSADGTANTIISLTPQDVTHSGAFKLDAPSNGQVVMWCAWSHGMGSV